MDKYKYIVVYDPWDANEIQVASTDNEVVDWISAKAQEQIPSCKIRRYGSSSKNPFIEGRGVDRGLYMWILMQLCESGWEPFAATEHSVHLRYKYSENDESNL